MPTLPTSWLRTVVFTHTMPCCLLLLLLSLCRLFTPPCLYFLHTFPVFFAPPCLSLCTPLPVFLRPFACPFTPLAFFLRPLAYLYPPLLACLPRPSRLSLYSPLFVLLEPTFLSFIAPMPVFFAPSCLSFYTPFASFCPAPWL